MNSVMQKQVLTDSETPWQKKSWMNQGIPLSWGCTGNGGSWNVGFSPLILIIMHNDSDGVFSYMFCLANGPYFVTVLQKTARKVVYDRLSCVRLENGQQWNGQVLLLYDLAQVFRLSILRDTQLMFCGEMGFGRQFHFSFWKRHSSEILNNRQSHGSLKVTPPMVIP